MALGQVDSKVGAQQLSIRHYDVSDGLAHSHVTAMHQDAKGYLWLATWEGLSRFDGYRFTNYGQRDGLGDPIINNIAEDRNGRLWVATNGGGVARLIDEPQISADAQGKSSAKPKQKFESFRISDPAVSNRVNAMLFDSSNNIWCATDGGLFRASTERDDLSFEPIQLLKTEAGMAAFADSRGRLWFGIENEIIEIVDGHILKYGPDDEVGRDKVICIVEDRLGRLLVANQRSLFTMIEPESRTDRGQWRKLPLTLKPDQGISSMLVASDGTLWIGTWNGLIKYHDGKQTLYTSGQGLSDNSITALAEDRDGNLWIGTNGGGVCKLSSELIISFTKTEGLPNQNVQKVIEDRAGHIYASIENGGLIEIVQAKAVAVPESQTPPFTDINERILQDQHRDWLIGTEAGLFLFQGPELQLRRGHKFTAADGISEGSMMGGLFQDPNGKVWVYAANHGLYYTDRAQSGNVRFKHLLTNDAAPAGGVHRIISDPAGDLWLAAHEQLGKVINGRLEIIEPTEGLPENRPRTFFVDSRGWLWIGLRYKGVSVTKDPGAETPSFINYSTTNGLASDSVWAITEDDLGRMYFGTGKGLDQLDLASGRIRHFNTDDGLASDIINYCLKDREGNIWIGTTLGLSRFNPRVERNVDQPAPTYLSRVQVAGEDLTMPETGALQLPSLELSASRNNLLIEYVALSFDGENRLHYQFKLDGVDSDWSAPTETRSINYAHLAAGSYQFLVRSINQQGSVSEAAAFRFRILRPFWLRWWFLSLCVVLIGLAIYATHRSRVARLVELERVRTRIASDLHDDIGANLSLIAMLSDVARGNLKGDDQRMKEWFSTIATTSRDTVDAMSDIVWAVNPSRDHLRDLTQRMRRFAEDLLCARGIELEFRPPDSNRDVRVGADVRREVFLILKESVNNIASHSACTLAVIELQLERAWLVLQVRDDGCGFDLNGDRGGNGLASMRQRAKKLGGSLDLSSANGNGTTLILRVPLENNREHGVRISPGS
jgi:ligand-binding sensor domain-containing protein/signal transduction histidine kinase